MFGEDTAEVKPAGPRAGDAAPAECERRAWLREEMGSSEGEFLLCTDCGDGAMKGCICHTVCRSCGRDDLIRVCPVSWSEGREGDDGESL